MRILWLHSLGTKIMSSVVEFVLERENLFRQGFAQWLEQNGHVWRRFEIEATRAWCHGRKHYSARTIAEYIRHDTGVKETSGPWKINNVWVPNMARLYMMLHPERNGFFELRDAA